MTKSVSIPLEIRKKVRAKRLTRLLLFVILLGADIFVVLKWGTLLFPLKEEQGWIRPFCYAVLLLLPLPLTKIYKLFTDTDYCGTVKAVKVKTTVDSKSATKPSLETLYRKNEVFLTLETENGKRIIRKAYEAPVGKGSNEEKYKIGSRVLHLHGTGVTVVLPTKADTHCQCAWCGGMNEGENERCSHCHAPMIKNQ